VSVINQQCATMVEKARQICLVYLFLREDWRAGTLPPFLRASLRPIAIACLRLFTFLPEPLLSVPFFFRCIADFTRLRAALPYLAIGRSDANAVLRSARACVQARRATSTFTECCRGDERDDVAESGTIFATHSKPRSSTMAKAGTLHDAFVDELRDTYDAEKQLTKALAKMAKAATSPDLKGAFEAHLEETRSQIERLDQVFASIEEKARGKHCEGIAGIIDEGKAIMEEDFGNATMVPV
jgi:hypothetical protein